MEISTFRDQRDNRPCAVDTTWAQLVESLRRVRRCACTVESCAGAECAHKRCRAWSPASYAEGATRAKKNVEAVSLLVLDHDDITTAQICEIEGRLRHHRRILHATHSDRASDGATRRIRSVIELSRPVPAAHWPTVWRSVVSALELPGVDTAACDASRLYYAPSRPSDAPYFFHVAEAP